MSALAFGMTPTVAVLAYEEGVSASVLVTLRGVVGTLVILGYAWATGRLGGLRRSAVAGLALLCGPLFGMQLLACFAAIESTGAQTTVVLIHVYPLFVIALVWIVRGQRASARVLGLSTVMIAGIALVAATGTAGIASAGVVLAVLSAAGYAIYLVLGERWVRAVGPVAATGLVTAGATVSVGAIAVLTDQDFAVSPTGWGAVLLQGLIITPIGVGGAFYAVRRLGPVTMSLIGLLEPVVGVLVAAAVLGERLTPVQWAGVVSILVSCAALPGVSRRRPKDISDRPDVTASI